MRASFIAKASVEFVTLEQKARAAEPKHGYLRGEGTSPAVAHLHCHVAKLFRLTMIGRAKDQEHPQQLSNNQYEMPDF